MKFNCVYVYKKGPREGIICNKISFREMCALHYKRTFEKENKENKFKENEVLPNNSMLKKEKNKTQSKTLHPVVIKNFINYLCSLEPSEELQDYFKYKILHENSWTRNIIVEDLKNHTGHQKTVINYCKEKNPVLLESCKIKKKTSNKETQTQTKTIIPDTTQERTIIRQNQDKKEKNNRVFYSYDILKLNINQINKEDIFKFIREQNVFEYKTLSKQILIYISKEHNLAGGSEVIFKEKEKEQLLSRLINPIFLNFMEKYPQYSIEFKNDMRLSNFIQHFRKYSSPTGRKIMEEQLAESELGSFLKYRNEVINYI